MNTTIVVSYIVKPKKIRFFEIKKYKFSQGIRKIKEINVLFICRILRRTYVKKNKSINHKTDL
jgi:hypothetical protein